MNTYIYIYRTRKDKFDNTSDLYLQVVFVQLGIYEFVFVQLGIYEFVSLVNIQ